MSPTRKSVSTSTDFRNSRSRSARQPREPRWTSETKTERSRMRHSGVGETGCELAPGPFHLDDASTYVLVLKIDHHLESAEHHALAVERHRLGIHHVREPRILHRLRVDAIAILARLVDDPGEPDLFALLELHAAREGSRLAVLHVVGHAFVVAQRAVVEPDLRGLGGHFLVRVPIPPRHGAQASIAISHGHSPRGLWDSPNCSAARRAH